MNFLLLLARVIIIYKYHIPFWAAVKTVALGAVDDLRHYRPRRQGRGR